MPHWVRKSSDIIMLEIVSSGKSLIILNTAKISVSFGTSFSSREKEKDSSYRGIGEDQDKTEIITGRDGKVSTYFFNAHRFVFCSNIKNNSTTASY